MKSINLDYIVLILLSLLIISCSSNNWTDFDSEQWRNWVETETTISLRWDMRKDLIKKHKLTGLSVQEVLQLLGEPENKSDSEFRYYLGMTGFGINTGSLILLIESGNVIDYKVTQG